jgi:hypothetical protein
MDVYYPSLVNIIYQSRYKKYSYKYLGWFQWWTRSILISIMPC